MKMTWVAVGDSNTCPDCLERHGETHTEEEWQQTYGEPRSVLADTACGRRCRCVLAPAVVEAEMSREEKQALEAAIDEAAGKMTGGLAFDLRRGGPTLLKDHGHRGLSSMPYAEVARVEEKIGRWKVANDYAPLPPEVWSGDLDQMEAWLDEALR